MKTSLLALVLLIAITVAAQTNTNRENAGSLPARDVTRRLIDLEEELGQAFVKSDIPTVERIEADDISTTQDDGTVTTKQQDIANLKSGNIKIESFHEYDFHVRVYQNTAVVTGQFQETGLNEGKEFDNTDRFTDVWVNQHGRWQLAVSQDTVTAKR